MALLRTEQETERYVTINMCRFSTAKDRFCLFSVKSAASKHLNLPCGISVSSDQFVYVCDHDNRCVSVFKTSGEFVTSFGQFSNPQVL